MKFAELHRLSAAKKMEPPTVLVNWWYKCYRVIHWCSQRGSVKPVNCIHIHSFHTWSVEKSKITMLELGSRQNMTDMDTKRARGKCIANVLVCQLCWTFFLIVLLHFISKLSKVTWSVLFTQLPMRHMRMFYSIFLFFCPFFSRPPQRWDNRSEERLNGFSWNFYQTTAGKMEFSTSYPNGG